MKADKIKIKNATREELVNEINMANEELSDRMFPVSGARSQKLMSYISEIQKELDMRDATLEEQQSIRENIDKISKPTGINFWELLEEYDNRKLANDIGEIMDREIYSKFPQGEFIQEIIEMK